MSRTTIPDRCRIVLVAPREIDSKKLEAALSGGDVASLILPQYDVEDSRFQAQAEQLCTIAQEQDIAVIIAGEIRIAARIQADGVHFEGGKGELQEIIDKYQSRMMVGCGGVKTRDDALELGETQPDYMFFGRFGFDTKPEPHSRNLSLAQWWAEMIEIPCVILGGADNTYLTLAADTGAEFIALEQAVFGNGIDPAEAVAQANAILDAGRS